MQEAPAPTWQILLDWWTSTNAEIETRHTTPEEIAALEIRYDVVLPEPFRDYLANACPADECFDWELTAWWHLARIKSVADDYEHPLSIAIQPYRDKLILFADYMIWAWAWAVNCALGPDYGKVALVSGDGREGFIADDFRAFVREYTRDPEGGFIHG